MEIAEQLIAKKVRELRQRHRLTLQQVSERANLSKSFLSKVERSNVSIGIAALSRLASVLGAPLGEFFDTGEIAGEQFILPFRRFHSAALLRHEVLVS